MAYHALLFCPDEKIAATVAQVLSELEFTVAASAEPFAAVKRLMGEHFDAVVVDCDNEQNAALLFKSARGSVNNPNALAVAIVEGQAGVAKAFRLGANLVLTKPVNVEQAKGTLRVARGLLKKNELAKPAAAVSAPVAPPRTPVAVETQAAVEDAIESEAAPEISKAVVTAKAPAQSPMIAKPAGPMVAALATAAKTEMAKPAASAPAPRPVVSASSAGSATAAAPARQIVEKSEEAVAPAKKVAVPAATEEVSSKPAATAFTFGGAHSEHTVEESSGGNKRVLGIVAALLVLGAAGYFVWPYAQAKLANHTSSTGQSFAAPTAAKTAPAAVVHTAGAVTAAVAASSKTVTGASGTPGAAGQPLIAAPAAVSEMEPSPGTPAAKPAPTTSSPAARTTAKATAQPIIMEHRPASARKSLPEVAAPGFVSMSSSGTGTMPVIPASSVGLPKPGLQTVKVSQGVSQGLVVKRVQPKYPASALQMRVEGDVSLLATISKSGDITAVSIVSGPPLLARTAADAVRQWKYKPYLLNGEPVEIQTDITVRFKLPR